MPNLPSGTVTFLFSDIEGSTALLKRLGDASYGELLALHRRLVRDGFAEHGGQEIDTQGDAFFYSFPRAREAVAAAVDVQRAHAAATWPGGERVVVRMGLHTGEPAVGDEGYTGLDVVRAARIAAVAHGGQILLSATTRALLGDDLPHGVAVHALGAQRLKDIDRPEPLHELRIEDGGVEAEPEDAVPERAQESFDVSRHLPAWLRNSTTAIPGVDRARQAIEDRVLREIERAFAEDEDLSPATPPVPPAGLTSLADEIERLREMRDSGALSAAQYDRAV